MTFTFWFWLVMTLWLIFGFVASWPQRSDWRAAGWVFPFLAVLCCGWQLFGAPVK